MGATKFSTTTALALAAVLLSSSTAAFVVAKVPKNSVGTKQLKNKAVSGEKVRNHTLGAIKMKSGVLPDISDYYTKAESTARYLRGTITRVASNSVPALASADVKVNCPEGYQATGGGVDSHDPNVLFVTSSSPLYEGNARLRDTTEGDHVAAVGWYASAYNSSGTAIFPLKVAVICSPIGGTVAP